MMIAEATKKVVERQDLTAAEAEQVMDYGFCKGHEKARN